MKKQLLFALILFCYSIVYGQENIYKGRVIDAEYHTPIAYAVVYIHNTNHGAISNNVGEFSINTREALSNAQLVVSKDGYILNYTPLETKTNNLLIVLQPNYLEDRVRMLEDSLMGKSGGFDDLIKRAIEFVMDDWIPLGNSETNKFDFGRIQTFPTYNPIEGVRLRGGFASNSRLSPHFFIKGYGAYGFGDDKFKYRGELTYSFDRKAYHEGEFLKNNINLLYENDLYSPGEMHLRSPNDLLLITYRRSENEATYRNFAEINWDKEHKNGLAHTTWLRKTRLIPQGELRFQSLINDEFMIDNELITSEVGLQLRYSAKEAYVQQKRKRIPIEMTSPVFFLSHSIGIAEFFEEKTTFHRTEFSAQKRFLLGSAGRFDVVGELMKVWNRAPFPLLVYPNQRHRHHIENNAFFLNRSLEFVADEQITLRTTFVGNDLLLAKIPLLNKLQFREVLSVRASYGRLSVNNQIGLVNSDNTNAQYINQYDFPLNSYEYGSQPYVEGVIGVTNILGLLRVEYVHRFTYRDHPNALLGKIRVDVTL